MKDLGEFDLPPDAEVDRLRRWCLLDPRRFAEGLEAWSDSLVEAYATPASLKEIDCTYGHFINHDLASAPAWLAAA